MGWELGRELGRELGQQLGHLEEWVQQLSAEMGCGEGDERRLKWREIQLCLPAAAHAAECKASQRLPCQH